MAIDTPLITCSILCYNYGRFLEKAIESVLNQTMDSNLFEVLVIDDGSTDNTPEICNKYKNKIRVSRTENLGFSQSLYRGIFEAKGIYVAYLDADDWWEPQKLELIHKYLDQKKLFVMHPMNEVDENEIALNRIGACGNTSSICVNREAALTLFPATTELYCMPLYDLGKGAIVNKPLGNYRIHGNAMTDRSPDSLHTEFFANTNFLVANNLKVLILNPPFWESEPRDLKNLSLWYYAEGCIKRFERSTEISSKMFFYWFAMVKAMLVARRKITMREFRLTMRALLNFIRLK